MSLEQKIALVTGAGKGIGAEIAKTLASDNATVIVSDINEAAAVNTINEINRAGHKAYFQYMNVADYSSVETAINDIENKYGKISILVNNAGVTKDTLLLRMKEADWDFVMNVNLKGAFNCTKHVAPNMLKMRWGRIINISSVVGQTGNIGQANYSASKAGLIGFTKTCAMEFASRNITVNAVAPGFIKSDMTDALNSEVQEAFLKKIPASRFGTSNDIAACVSFLASEKASYITGQVIGVNGGMLMI